MSTLSASTAFRLAALLSVSTACGADTGRGRTHFDFEVTGSGAGPFTSAAGYAITVTEARLSLAQVEFFEGEPLFSKRPSLGGRVWAALGWREAHAHPGHYVEGEALGDVRAPTVIDLLAAGSAHLEGDGVTGDYRSARIVLRPNAALEGSAVLIAGTATRAGETYGFRGALSTDETITGIAVGHTVRGGHGAFRMIVDLRRWLDRAELDEVGTSGELEPGTQPHNAFVRGVRSTSAYGFEYEEKE